MHDWMTLNKLKLNKEKKIIKIGLHSTIPKVSEKSLQIDNCDIVQNIWV